MYTVSFLPWQGSTLGHIENYGDLPLLQLAGAGASSSDGSFAWNATEQVGGRAPFTSALVAATTVTAATTTARSFIQQPTTGTINATQYHSMNIIISYYC